MKTITELVAERERLLADRAERRRLHHGAELTTDMKLQEIGIALAAARRGVSPEQFALAKTVMFQRGERVSSDDAEAIGDAMRAIAAGGGKLRSVYVGSKDYDRWHHQGTEHGYGYGPRHGTVVFAIGLCEEARKRDLTPEEIEACLAVLNAVAGGFRMDAQDPEAT